jgi:hypothetical protein
MKKVAFILGGLCAAGIALAAPAAADKPPAPSGDDTSSIGSVGNKNLGATLGRDGYSVSAGGVTATSRGWPVSRTTITGMNGKLVYDATTDYSGLTSGEVEHWSSGDVGGATFKNWFETGAAYQGYSQRAEMRYGSTRIVCRNHMCNVSR